LSYYNARWYDAQLGRFVSADTIVPEPGKPQALNRFSYVYNNPLRYVDPTGHRGSDRYEHDGGGAPPPPSDPEEAAESAARAEAVMTDIAATIAERYSDKGTSWDDLPSGVRDRAARHGVTRGWYEDGPNATSMAGTWADPAVIASGLFAGARVYAMLARLAPYLGPAGSFIARQATDAANRLRQWWAGGTRPYLVSRGMVFGYRSPVRATDLTLGRGVTQHLNKIAMDPTKPWYGERARPFLDSRLLMQEIMDAAPPIRDPRGMPNYLRWDVPGYFRGRYGMWELVVNIRNREVTHFNFKGFRR
jgi:hypothetical protein